VYIKARIKQINKNIDYYIAYIKDLKASFIGKYIAKLVYKLEKSTMGTRTKQIYANKYLINLENTVKYYNNKTLAVKVLANVNLKIKSGEFVVILGPSGSGKTTLLNIISGMDTATYGRTIVANHNLIKYNSAQLTQFRRENVGYIFQQYGLLPNLTVSENVEIGSNLQKDKKKRIEINELLKNIGIYEQRNKFPRELSGGQQQRVSIARSMAKNPRLIFGDEPTGAIDTEMSKQIMQLFVDINKRYKTTIIIVTHNPAIADLATMVVRVKNGRIDSIVKNKNPKSVNQIN
jgi:putative ABC transport system ATP-binding protein